MTLKYTCLILILLWINPKANGQNNWTLEQCINHAIQNNITIKQQEVNVTRSQNNVNQALWSQTPSISASGNSSVNFGRSLDYTSYTYLDKTAWNGNFGLSAQSTLFGGFNVRNNISKNKLDLQAALQDLDKTKNDISLNVAAAYLQVLFSEELVTNTTRQVELTKAQVERTKKLVDAGNLSMSNLFDMQSQEAQEEVNLVNAQNQLNIAYLSLKQLLEIPAETPFDVYHPNELPLNENYPLSTPSIIFENSQNMPEIKSAEIKVESAEKSIKIAQSAYYPNLSLSAQYGTNFFSPQETQMGKISIKSQLNNNQSTNLGVSLRIPIFNSMSTKYSVNNARLGYSSAQLSLQQAKNTLYKQISQAHADAAGALKKYHATQKANASFAETFKSVEIKFNVGSANSIDYNTAKNNFAKSESELLQSKFDFIFKTKILDFYKGIAIKL